MNGTDLPPDERGSQGIATPYQPNFALAWLYERFFSKIEVDPAWVSAVRAASALGTVVHVMRSQSYLDFVALDFFLKRFDLPPLRFVSDTGFWVLEPLGQGLRGLLRADRTPEASRLERAVSEAFAALLFMRRPPDFTDGVHRGRAPEVDTIRVLLDLQPRHPRPILLLPQVFIWGKVPDTRQRTLVDLLFGPTDYPGRLRVMSQFLGNHRNTLLRAGEPLDLRAYVQETPDLDEDARVRKIHWTLFRRLDRERRVVLGPVAKGPDRLAHEILRTPRVRQAAVDAAAREKRSLALVNADLYRTLRQLEARPDPDAIALADVTLSGLFRTVFDSVEVDPEGFARIRAAALRGPVVLLPSHRSHVDYVVLSWVCIQQGLQTPLIAAGDNLDFWPLGPILRRGGAFFIRRSMGGESTRLYATLLDAYVRKMMREGYLIEFFIEGGRSRSGRLLAPKYGLLSLVLDAATTGGEAVSLAPISVVYDRVVEESTYAAELSGRAKQREDLGALLRVPRALASRHGRIHVEVGDIVTWSPPASLATEGATDRKGERDRMVSRRAQVTRVAHQVCDEIQRVTPVTAMGLAVTALLSHPGRGMALLDVRDATHRLLALVEGGGARLAADLRTEGDTRACDRAVDRALGLLREAGHLRTLGDGADAAAMIPDEHRLAVEHYKNNMQHFVVVRAMVALGLSRRALTLGRPRDELLARAARIEVLFGREYTWRPPREATVDRALAGMLEHGELVAEGEVIRASVDDAPWVALLAGSLASAVEGRRIAARTLMGHMGKSSPAEELLHKALAVGRKMFVTGEIQRREAVSRAAVASAFAAFREMGVLGGGEGGPQRLKAPWETSEAMATLEGELAAYG